jgi:Txe/YoeB family toxin of Txe-Axe toxin-antitoxin module
MKVSKINDIYRQLENNRYSGLDQFETEEQGDYDYFDRLITPYFDYDELEDQL